MPLAQKVKIKHPYIVSLKTYCGGRPVKARTKIPVKSIAFYILRQGMTPEELIKEFSHLSLPQIYNTLSYYYDHREEIDKEFITNFFQ